MFKKANLTTALLTLSSGLIAAILTSYFTWLIYMDQVQLSRDSILMGIAGEIESIKGTLEKQLRTLKEAERKGVTLKKYSFYYPREYYGTVISEIGKLNNRSMVRKIVIVYSQTERVKAEAVNIDNGVYDKDADSHRNYRESLEMVFHSFMHTLLSLQPYLEKYPDENWSMKVPKWYKRDQELLKHQPSVFEFADGKIRVKESMKTQPEK